eukprot:1544660-Ditylum_brightwellii.AAC.1
MVRGKLTHVLYRYVQRFKDNLSGKILQIPHHLLHCHVVHILQRLLPYPQPIPNATSKTYIGVNKCIANNPR